MECDVDKCSTEANVGDCVSINKTFNATIPVSLKAPILMICAIYLIKIICVAEICNQYDFVRVDEMLNRNTIFTTIESIYLL